MQASIFGACPSQDKIERVVPGRTSGVKMVGWQRWEHQLVRIGWQSIWIVGASACVIFTLLKKIEKMVNKDMIFRYHPVGAPHAYTNRRWGNTAGTQHNPVLGCRVISMMT